MSVAKQLIDERLRREAVGDDPSLVVVTKDVILQNISGKSHQFRASDELKVVDKTATSIVMNDKSGTEYRVSLRDFKKFFDYRMYRY